MSTKTSTKRSTKKTKEIVEEPVVEHHDETETEHEEVDEKKSRTRRVVSKETLISSIQELNTQLEAELSKQRDSSEKHVVGNRFIRRVHKALRVIESDAKKVLKMKTSNRKASATSGFMKPVMISEEMARFTGLDKNGAYPRPTITKFVCDYVKTHNLQNPNDKREFRVDTPLQKLLQYNPANPPKDDQGKPIPMTYFRLQKYMQHHFKQTSSETPAPVASPSTPAPVASPSTPAPVASPSTPAPATATATASKRKAK
jgi:chromatin remodeling complex protein RSC6